MLARLHYDLGSGPAAAYVPGIDGTGNYLLGTADRLAERFRVVGLRYELEEASSEAEDRYGTLAASVAARLGEAGIERALIVTESFGGGVSLRLALDHPELVAGLLIVNSFAYYPWRFRLALSRVTAPLVPRWSIRALRQWTVPPAMVRPRRDEEAEEQFFATSPAFFDIGYRRRLRMIRTLDLRERLADVHQPVALYASDSDRIVDSVPAAEVMHAGLPDSTLEILEQAGHFALPLREEPWLERLEHLAARAGLR